MSSILSVDVEDWYHILDVSSVPDISAWDSMESRVEGSFLRLLDLIDEAGAKCTCFFLGWVAERHPRLVREAVERGHEPASHGYSHRLVYSMSQEEFRRDARHSRKLIEDLAGRPVAGYRSAGFSVTEDVPWFFEALADCGYTYDSSVFPAPRSHGGMKTGKYAPHPVRTPAGRVVEFPISVVEILGRPLYLFGGGYLRLFPYPLIRHMARRVLASGRPVIYYVHPRELDPEQPRLTMPVLRRFKSYVNLKTTEPKLKRALADFRLVSFENYLGEHPGPMEER
jgi:polysaccharide deacetylase family protein (PEP-CTERM system associated)